MISFNEIENSLTPYMQAEIDSSSAVQGPGALPYRLLLIGSATSAGSRAADELISITDADQAKTNFGAGSQLHQMAECARKVYRTAEIYCIAAAKDDLEESTGKAAGSIAITVDSSEAGTIAVYIGGRRVSVTVSDGDTEDAIAEAIAEAINADPLMGVVADGTTLPGTVDLEAKNAGEEGDKISIHLNYLDGEAMPAGVTAVITSMTGGSGNPDVTSALNAVAEEWFQVIACPYTDAANQGVIDTEMERKFSAQVGIDGAVILADNSQFSTLTTNYDADNSGENSKHLCIVGSTGIPNTPWEVAATVAGAVCASLRTGNGSESRPFTTLELPGLLAPKTSERFDFVERNTLLGSGVSTLKVAAGGRVIIERLVTNYQKNAHDAQDSSWRNLNYRFIAMYLRWDWIINVLVAKYSRAKLANDGVRFGPGQVVMTPKLGKAEALARFRVWEQLGLVENYEQFKEDLIAERNAGNVDRMDWLMCPDFVNQFYHGATKIAFRL